MHPNLRIAVLGAAVAAAGLAQATPNPVAVYDFNSSFASSVAGAPALTAVDPLGLSGFGTDIVGGVSRTVYNFSGTPDNDRQAGLSLDVSSLLAGHADEYSIELVFKFTENDGAWRRIVDVQNRTSDNGFYVDPDNALDIYPVRSGGGFTNGVYHDVFLVNDHGTATFYLDGGAPTVATTSVMDIDGSQTMNFFLDNIEAAGQHEYSSGSIAMIRLYDSALTSVPPPVPEPATAWMLLAGVATLGAAVRRRR